MSGVRLARALAWAPLCCGLLIAGGPAPAADDNPQPRIFKWVDEHGIAHYTTDESRIPRAIRKRMRSLGPTPDVAAPAPRRDGDADLIGPLPKTPPHPEGWASQNAPPTPTEDELEVIEAAERSAELEAMDAEIAGLEGQIADREEQLLAMLASATGGQLVDDAAFRQIADELPGLQADLEALRERRGELATAP